MTQFPQRHPLGYRFPWNDADCLHPPTVMLSDLLSVVLSPIASESRVDCCRAPRSSIVLLELPVSCPHPRPE